MWGLYHSLLSDKATAENAFRLSGLSTYQSRGKGKGKAFARSHFSNKSKQASRSKYMPHQGKQEMIRREIQENRRIFGKDFHFSKIQYTTIMANLKAANQSEGERKYG
jgi:hypothetical protein